VSSRNRIPEKLETIGDHILRRRLSLKQLQRQVAEQLGAKLSTVRSWEMNRAKPTPEFMPAIIRFLGYNPLPPGRTWAERLVNTRTALGLSQRESAQRMGVDPSTLAKWERGEREPAGRFMVAATTFVSPQTPFPCPIARSA
jgi:transcriptional regulator with XRE-family HTH domain